MQGLILLFQALIVTSAGCYCPEDRHGKRERPAAELNPSAAGLRTRDKAVAATESED